MKPLEWFEGFKSRHPKVLYLAGGILLVIDNIGRWQIAVQVAKSVGSSVVGWHWPGHVLSVIGLIAIAYTPLERMWRKKPLNSQNVELLKIGHGIQESSNNTPSSQILGQQCRLLHATIDQRSVTLSLGNFENISSTSYDLLHLELLELDDDSAGAVLIISFGLAMFVAGSSVQNRGGNKYWLPKNGDDAPWGRIANYYLTPDLFTMTSISLYHSNPHAKEVTLNIAFVKISY